MPKLRGHLSYIDKYGRAVFALIDGVCDDGREDTTREILGHEDIPIAKSRACSTFLVSFASKSPPDISKFMGRQCIIEANIATYKFFSKMYGSEISGKRLVLENISLIKE